MKGRIEALYVYRDAHSVQLTEDRAQTHECGEGDLKLPFELCHIPMEESAKIEDI